MAWLVKVYKPKKFISSILFLLFRKFHVHCQFVNALIVQLLQISWNEIGCGGKQKGVVFHMYDETLMHENPTVVRPFTT